MLTVERNVTDTLIKTDRRLVKCNLEPEYNVTFLNVRIIRDNQHIQRTFSLSDTVSMTIVDQGKVLRFLIFVYF